MTKWDQFNDNSTSYTELDTPQIRAKLVEYLQETQDKLTDFNESSVISILVELISGVGDMLSFRLDRQALETYLPTAKQRKNVKALLSLINYKMDMVNSAKSVARFSVRSDYPYSSTILIPRYTQVSGSDNKGTIYYATSVNAEIPVGESSIDVPIIQGVVNEISYKISELLESNRIYINTSNLAQGSVIITIDEEEWTEVPDVTIIDNDAKTFSVHEDKYDRPYILFHRNYERMLPTDTSLSVNIQYLDSLGTKGEIRDGFISRVMTDTLVSVASGNRMYDVLSVTNIGRSSGSSDRETVDHARIQAPRELTTVDRAITLDDYDHLLNGLPGVVKGVALDWKIDNMSYVSAPYQVDLYVVPSTGQEASPTQLRDIEEFFSPRKMSSLTVSAKSASYVDISISANVYVIAPSTEFDRIKEAVTRKVTEYFDPNNQVFGAGVRSSNLTTLIETSDTSIDYIELLSPSSMNLRKNEFPRLVDIKLNLIESR